MPEQAAPALAIYRGWMLKPATYSRLYEALAAKGFRLISDPAAYVHCHHLPESYSVIEKWTPKSVSTKIGGDVDMDRIMDLLQPFGTAPLVLKDFVKSRKHEWNEACYIPSASDRSCVERVVHRFLELVDDDLNEGLVFREFVDFEPLTRHSKSGMPLTKEFRLFFGRQAGLLDRILEGGRLCGRGTARGSIHEDRCHREEPVLRRWTSPNAGMGTG